MSEKGFVGLVEDARKSWLARSWLVCRTASALSVGWLDARSTRAHVSEVLGGRAFVGSWEICMPPHVLPGIVQTWQKISVRIHMWSSRSLVCIEHEPNLARPLLTNVYQAPAYIHTSKPRQYLQTNSHGDGFEKITMLQLQLRNKVIQTHR